ncbi:transposase [Mesorhizobium sp. M0991]|uniref:transposase n=1 Tax=Mesorhizobium sp. M0991 TaxID=2957043 RepID=UPI003338FC2F
MHGYASGIYSSRRIARAACERADFMMIVAGDTPDFRTISEFRRRHLKALAALFVQVLQLAEKAGLVKLGHVALDGTKITANASKHKAMSYERMKKREAELEAEVDRWLKAAEAADREEDKLYGKQRGDEMPDWVASRSDWRRFARPRPNWRRKPRPPPKRRCAAGIRRRSSARQRAARRTARRRRHRRRNLWARRSATSPIRKAAS